MKNLLGKSRKIVNTADENELVTDYVFTHYLSADNMCSLCGQRGIIDTRGVQTPAGYPAGRLNWCLCPNGQAMREQAGERLPADFPEYSALMLTDNVGTRVPVQEIVAAAKRDAKTQQLNVVIDTVLNAVQGNVIKLTWGPDSGRPAGYFVSVPELGSCEVIKVSDLRKALGKE
jgi:hypothetical protein